MRPSKGEIRLRKESNFHSLVAVTHPAPFLTTDQLFQTLDTHGSNAVEGAKKRDLIKQS